MNKIELKYYKKLYQISIKLAGELEFESLTNGIVNGLSENLDYPVVVFFNYDKKTNFYYSHTLSNNFLASIVLKFYTKGFREHGYFMNSEDLPTHFVHKSLTEQRLFKGDHLPDFISPTLAEALAVKTQQIYGIKEIVAIPVIVKEEAIGVIMVCNKKEFLEFELEGLQKASELISQSAKNVKFVQEQQLLIENLRKKNAEVSSIFHMNNGILRNLNFQKMSNAALDVLPKELGLKGGMITFYDVVNSSLQVIGLSKEYREQYTKAISSDKFYIAPLRYSSNELNKVVSFELNQITVCDRVTDAFSPELVSIPLMKLFEGDKNIRETINVPLQTENQFLGIATYFLDRKVLPEKSKEMFNLLQTYTTQITSGMENVRLLISLNEVRKDLERKNKELRDYAQKEKDILDIMGHELRTPITIVRNSLDLINSAWNSENRNEELISKYLTMAIRSTKREINIIETMLAATKIEGGKIALNRQKVKIKEVVEEAIQGQKSKAEAQGLELKTSFPETETLVFADRSRIQEVMDNFVSNAVKYTQKGSVSINVSADAKFAYIGITDTGDGIPPEDIENLGKKFYRSQQHITENNKTDSIVRPGGTGLGLFVTFGLVKQHGGTVEVKSELGKGSTFTFSIPLYINQVEEVNQSRSKDLLEDYRAKREKGKVTDE